MLKIPYTPRSRSQPSFVHIPHPHTVAHLRNYKQPTAIKTTRVSPNRTGIDTASLLSSDVHTAYLSGNLFSEVLVPTPVAPHVRIREYYTYDQSRPPTPNFADYPIRVDEITI